MVYFFILTFIIMKVFIENDKNYGKLLNYIYSKKYFFSYLRLTIVSTNLRKYNFT